MPTIIFFISSCPFITQSSMTSSESSLASDSTIRMASVVPATIKSSAESFISETVGLMTGLLSMKPTLTPAIGPLNGISDIDKAADAAIMEITSVCTSGLRLMTVMTTCTSLRKSSLNDGLKGLSISLEISVSFSEGLPSRLKNPPGIFPAA